MEVISCKLENMQNYGKTTSCHVYSIHVKITDIGVRAREMIDMLSNKSWINELGIIPKMSYEARAERTIEKLINDILKKVSTTVSTEFGEFLVSASAQDSLKMQYNHTKVPLAELLKEKVTGNPGFDFHTESHTNLIAFGEAKYSGTGNPYRNAMEQIANFVVLKKDVAELVDLQYFVSAKSVENIKQAQKGFVAAFSINSQNPKEILNNALCSIYIDDLLVHDELYVIGIEVNA